jgi:hypothetical protein
MDYFLHLFFTHQHGKPKALPRVADVAKQAEFIWPMMRRYTSQTPCIQNIKANLPLVG